MDLPKSIGQNSPAFSNDGSVIYVTNDATPHPLMAFPSAVGPSAFWHNGDDDNPQQMGAFSPTVAPDGRIFLHQWSDRPHAASDYGSHLATTWSAQTSLDECYSNPALYETATGLQVIATGRTGLIGAYDGGGGLELWTLATGHFTDADPTVDPATGNIYLPMGDQDIYVAGMLPIGVASDINTTEYVDQTSDNGISYYYAVTAISTGGGEITDVPAIGPRTPWDESDLQVVSIARSSLSPRYAAQYTGYEIAEPSGFGPYYFSASTGLGGGQTFADPRFPTIGESVAYTATIRNRGTNPFDGTLAGTWRVDGAVVDSPSLAVTMAPGDTATFEYLRNWDAEPHELMFTLDTLDHRLDNNTLVSDPLAVPFLTYLDRSFVEEFREVYTADPVAQNDDIIDWLNSHLARFNEMFDDAGTQKRVHYGVLEVLDDNAPDPPIDRSPYAIFPLRYHAADGNPRLSGYYHADEDIDYGLLHEMGHQLGLIDIYQLDVPAEANLVSGIGYSGPDGLMRGVSPQVSEFSALAMEHWLHQGHGYYGQFLYNLPETIELRILGFDGNPLPGAVVKAYQYCERPGQGKVITDQIKFQGTTDADGILVLPNVSIDPLIVPPAGTGDALSDNPFGYVDVVGRNGVLHFRVEINGASDHCWLDITEANLAYGSGQTQVAVFERQLALGGPVQTEPPADMAELNANDWIAWADGATASVEDDLGRRIAGTGSLKFITEGGFDTSARYPGAFTAQWDVTAAAYLDISFFAENDNIGFQSGSPWIFLRDGDGNYFHYQYYQNGNPYNLLNEAQNQWQSYRIPLDAAPDTVTGWRRTVSGTPDLSNLKSLEIHADTWDFGFTLWIDGVGFVEPIPGDFNTDSNVDGDDLDIWKDGLGTASGAGLRDGDADGDSDVDGNDFLIWQRHYSGNPALRAAADRITSSESTQADIAAFPSPTYAVAGTSPDVPFARPDPLLPRGSQDIPVAPVDGYGLPSDSIAFADRPLPQPVPRMIYGTSHWYDFAQFQPPAARSPRRPPQREPAIETVRLAPDPNQANAQEYQDPAATDAAFATLSTEPDDRNRSLIRGLQPRWTLFSEPHEKATKLFLSATRLPSSDFR